MSSKGGGSGSRLRDRMLRIEAIAAPSVRARWLRLLRLARIGPHEEHPAVAQANMRHLDRGGRPIDQDNLVAPLELIGFAGGKTQRHEGGRGTGALSARPETEA